MRISNCIWWTLGDAKLPNGCCRGKSRCNSKMYKKNNSNREKTVSVFSYKTSGQCSACLRELLKKKRNKGRNERNMSFSWLTNYKRRGIMVGISLRNSVPEKKGSQAESQHWYLNKGNKLLLMDTKGCTFSGGAPCTFQHWGGSCLHPPISWWSTGSKANSQATKLSRLLQRWFNFGPQLHSH